MANRGSTKYLLPEYMSHVRKCIANASISMQIKWFESVEQLFKHVCIVYTLHNHNIIVLNAC